MKTMTLEQKVESQFGKIISKFPILHHEWEMDGYGFIVENNDKRDIVLTHHGNLMVVGAKELHKYISTYRDAIQQTERALFLLK
jgi:hypothetical protein